MKRFAIYVHLNVNFSICHCLRCVRDGNSNLKLVHKCEQLEFQHQLTNLFRIALDVEDDVHLTAFNPRRDGYPKLCWLILMYYNLALTLTTVVGLYLECWRTWDQWETVWIELHLVPCQATFESHVIPVGSALLWSVILLEHVPLLLKVRKMQRMHISLLFFETSGLKDLCNIFSFQSRIRIPIGAQPIADPPKLSRQYWTESVLCLLPLSLYCET